tara:strand:- start:786 stop:977 length:192 start_codon:yes stop_codon:yes gene_type:complete
MDKACKKIELIGLIMMTMMSIHNIKNIENFIYFYLFRPVFLKKFNYHPFPPSLFHIKSHDTDN